MGSKNRIKQYNWILNMYDDAQPKKDGVFKVIEFMGMDNIAKELDKPELDKIGFMVVEEYEEDCESRADWEEINENALKLAKQVRESKTFPWSGASNVKFPLVSQAALNFNARAFPEIVQGDKVCKAVVVGQDEGQTKEDRAERVSSYMSWQLTTEIPNWESDTDKLLLMLPIVGTMFREVTWDEINLRPEINLLMPDELVVNYHAKSLDLSECRRISKEIIKYKNDIIERERAGLWLEIDYSTNEDDDAIEKSEQVYIQQSRYLDLDKDGYEEPYTVLVHKDSKQVVRITALYNEYTVKINTQANEITKIEPLKQYADYHFIPAFDGGFYSTGFGSYLYPMNQTIDTLINQLIDAGTLSNLQSGFLGKGLRQKMGATPMQPGEWRPVDSKGGDISQNIVPLPVKEPSMTLYQLMVFLIDTGKDMSSITDVMSGVIQGANTPVGTTMAMIEQGMKVIDAVYKRIYLALKKEFKMLFLINERFLDGSRYLLVSDNKEAQVGDFNSQDMDIIPVGDTRISSQMLRRIRAQEVMQIAGSVGGNLNKAGRNYLKSIDVPEAEIDEILPEPDPNAVDPIQQLQFKQMAMDAEFREREMRIKEQEIATKQMKAAQEMRAQMIRLQAELETADADRVETLTKAIKNLAEVADVEERNALTTIQQISEQGYIDDLILEMRQKSNEELMEIANGI